jgi:hypothetical protein
MTTTRFIRTLAAAIALSSCVQLAAANLARADASGHASCNAIEASALSPPGSSDEFPGGMAEAAAIINDLARQLGIPPGAIFASAAKLHEGSHEACDEATE